MIIQAVETVGNAVFASRYIAKNDNYPVGFEIILSLNAVFINMNND